MKPTFRELVNYKVERYLSKGGMSIFLSLTIVFIAIFILILFLRYLMMALFPDLNYMDNFWEDILGDEAASASPEKQLSSLFRESNSPKEETGQLQKARKPARIEKKQTFNRTRTQTIEL